MICVDPVSIEKLLLWILNRFPFLQRQKKKSRKCALRQMTLIFVWCVSVCLCLFISFSIPIPPNAAFSIYTIFGRMLRVQSISSFFFFSFGVPFVQDSVAHWKEHMCCFFNRGKKILRAVYFGRFYSLSFALFHSRFKVKMHWQVHTHTVNGNWVLFINQQWKEKKKNCRFTIWPAFFCFSPLHHECWCLGYFLVFRISVCIREMYFFFPSFL